MPKLLILGSLPPRHLVSLCRSGKAREKLCLYIYLSASNVGGRDLYPLSYRIDIDLQDTMKPRRIITVGLQVKNGLPVLSNASQQ